MSKSQPVFGLSTWLGFVKVAACKSQGKLVKSVPERIRTGSGRWSLSKSFNEIVGFFVVEFVKVPSWFIDLFGLGVCQSAVQNRSFFSS